MGDIVFWILFGGAAIFIGILVYEEFFASHKSDDMNIKIGGTD